jgi:hypothetical protein
VKGKIVTIEKARKAELHYPSLASLYQGPLAVLPNEHQHNLAIIDTYYAVLVDIDSIPSKNIGSTYVLRTRGPTTSYLLELMRFIFNVLLKESSF